MQNAFNHFGQGWDQAQGIQDQVSRARAGNALASGDYSGGANMLLKGGMLTEGLAAQKYGQNQQDDQRAREKADRAEQLDFTLKASKMLKQLAQTGGPEALSAGFDRLAPIFAQMNGNAEQIGQYKQAILADPGLLDAIAGEAERELQIVNRGDGGYDVVDKGDGSVVRSTPREYKPDWRERTRPDGSTEFFDITAEGGLGSQPPQASPNALAPRAGNADQVVASLTSQGARVTSGVRTPERNAAVGGQPNSYHLASRGGVARDLVPPPGVSMAQFHAQVKSQLPAGWEAINEGDHVHIEPGPGASRQMARGPGTVRGDAPKPASGATPPSGFRWKADGSLEPIPGGPADTISQGGKVTGEERTAGFLSSRLADSLKNLAALDQTSPDASKPGLMEKVAENAPWVGGQGTANLVRSSDRQQVIANQLDVLDAALTLGTGAAYTREQLLNYRDTYFPALTDKPATVTAKRGKLIALLNAAKIKAGRSAPPELDQALAAARAQWGGSSAQPARAATPAPAKANATQAGPRVGEVRKGYRFKGGDPSKPASWTKVQ